MARIDQKLDIMQKALNTLQTSITLCGEYKQKSEENLLDAKAEQIFLGMRDSMIQRFEYCVDLLWKLLKLYLEEVEKVTLVTYSPRGVIREAIKARVISETEGPLCMKMIDNRNLTSHIYHEETATDIAEGIPAFHELMLTIVSKLQTKLLNARTNG